MESKQEYINGLIKDVTRKCFSPCFSNKSLDIDKNCLDNCFEKYLETLKRTADLVKDIGYEYQSPYSYKIFPERDPYYELLYGHDLSAYMMKFRDHHIYHNYMSGEGI